jgi:hypothetical protein
MAQMDLNFWLEGLCRPGGKDCKPSLLYSLSLHNQPILIGNLQGEPTRLQGGSDEENPKAPPSGPPLGAAGPVP